MWSKWSDEQEEYSGDSKKFGLGWSSQDSSSRGICHRKFATRAIKPKGRNTKEVPETRKLPQIWSMPTCLYWLISSWRPLEALIPTLATSGATKPAGTQSIAVAWNCHSRGWIEWLLCQLISQQCLQAANKCVWGIWFLDILPLTHTEKHRRAGIDLNVRSRKRRDPGGRPGYGSPWRKEAWILQLVLLLMYCVLPKAVQRNDTGHMYTLCPHMQSGE